MLTISTKHVLTLRKNHDRFERVSWCVNQQTDDLRDRSMTADPSFSNHDIATDDDFGLLEDELGILNLSTFLTFDVMANDLGGKAKSLFSVDDGNGNLIDPSELLNADSIVNGVSAWETTDQGNQVRINNGQLEFDLSHTLGLLGATDINGLGAADVIQDSVIYAIRLGNGALSWAHVTFLIQGQNDVASISGVSSLSLTEDDSIGTGNLVVTDPDHDESHTQVVVGGLTTAGFGTYSVDADGNWSYAVDTAQHQHLALGQSVTDTFVVSSLDGTATQEVTVTINGANDGPTAVDDAAAADEDGPLVSGSVAGNDGDMDDGAVLTYALIAPVDGLTLNSDGSYEFNPSDAAYQYLAEGETIEVVANYAVTDEHGASASSALTISIIGANDAVRVVGGATSGSVGEQSPLQILLADDFNRSDSDSPGETWIEVAENNNPYTDSSGRYVDAHYFHLESNELQLTTELNPGRLTNFYYKGVSPFILVAPLEESLGEGEVEISFDYKTGPDESTGPRVGLMNSQAGFISYPAQGIDMAFYRSDSHYNNSSIAVEKFDGNSTPYSPGGSHLMPFQIDTGYTYHFSIVYQLGGNTTVSVSNGSSTYSFTENLGSLNFELDQLYIVGGTDISFGTPGLLENTNSIDNMLVTQVANPGVLTTSGSLVFEDADLSDQHTVSVIPQGGGYRGNFSYLLHDSTGIGSGSLDWTFGVENEDIAYLDSGQVLEQSYDITIDDGHGGTTTQTVVVTINGSDELIV